MCVCVYATLLYTYNSMHALISSWVGIVNFFFAQQLFGVVSKAVRVWGKTTKKMDKVKLYFQQLKEKLAYIFFFSKSDEESYSPEAGVENYLQCFYCILFIKGHIINNLLTLSTRSLQGNLRPRPCCIDRTIARSIHQGKVWYFPVMISFSVNYMYYMIISN